MDKNYGSIENLENEVNETKNIMIDNCNKIIERDEYLSNLEDKAELLSSNSVVFNTKSRQLKNSMWVKSNMFYFIGFIILLLIIIIITVVKKK